MKERKVYYKNNADKRKEYQAYFRKYYLNTKFKVRCDVCDTELVKHGYKNHLKTIKHHDNLIKTLKAKDEPVEDIPEPEPISHRYDVKKYQKTFEEKHPDYNKVKYQRYKEKHYNKKKYKPIDKDKPFDNKIVIVASF